MEKKEKSPAVKQKQSKLKTYDHMGYVFVAPFVIVFLIFSVYPVLRTLYLSFTDAKLAGVGEQHFVWFDNYKRVFTDKFFWRSLWNRANLGCQYRTSVRTCIFTDHCVQ